MKKGLPREAKPGELVSLDLEMFGQEEGRLHRPHGTFACLSISFGPRETYQVYDVPDLRSALGRVKKGLWCFQNATYDLRQLRAFAPIPQRTVWDTMLVEQGLFAGWYLDFGLDHLARRWLGRVLLKNVRKDFGTRTTMTEEMKNYAARDAYVTWMVAKAQQEYCDEEAVSLEHYWEIDEPCIWAVIDMPPAHINVDGWLQLATHHQRLGEQLEETLGVNVFSPKEVKSALETELGMPIKDTSGKDTLQPLLRTLRAKRRDRQADYLQMVLEARRYRKAANTYGADWVEQHVEDGGLVYGDYRINGTRTCRFSCSHPNLQNIPTRELPIFRKLFTSRYKGQMYVADMWSQEPCILAWWSEDPILKEALLAEVDLHQQAADDFGLSRRDGKDVNLGLGYGMTEWGLAARTGLSKSEAREGIRKRNLRYRVVNEWNTKMVARARALDYVQTSLGRRLWINKYDNQWERHAINFPVQGTAAEQTKLWLIMCHQHARDEGMPFRIPLVVHDELVADVPRGEGRAWRTLLNEMGVRAGEKAIPGFPMKVEIGSGHSWAAKV